MMVTLAVGSYVALRLRDSGATDMDWSWLLRSLLVSAIIAAAVLRHLYVQHHWRLRIQGAASARIDALQARIRPHFLFNSLNTIAATIATDPRRAESLVEDLSDLFRASLGQSRQVIPFSDEHRLALGYLEMEQLRMGDRLAIEQDLATIPEDALIPPLTLQPLLENAVYYGAEPSEAGATIRLKGRCRDGELILTVSNPSPPERARGRSGFGSAQANVGERLRLAFGERAQLSTHESEGVYCVTLRLPYRQGGVDEDLDR
jgi:two-component system sensor histidine kinase AlgZ